jgi:hypothetical protein
MSNRLGESERTLPLRELGIKAVEEQFRINPLVSSLQKNAIAIMIRFWMTPLIMANSRKAKCMS